MNRIWNFLRSDDGPTAIEYALMVALIVVVCRSSNYARGISTRSYLGLANHLHPATSSGN